MVWTNLAYETSFVMYLDLVHVTRNTVTVKVKNYVKSVQLLALAVCVHVSTSLAFLIN